MATPVAPAAKTYNGNQTSFLHLLSRADTLHDFVGDRSILSKNEVIDVLNTSEELNENTLGRHILGIKDQNDNSVVNEKNLDGILTKSVAPLVNINFPNTFTPKIIKRISDIKAYEPRTVLFYEMYEHVLEGVDVNLGKYVSHENLVYYSYVDGKYINGDESAFTSATMAFLNLGTTAKPSSGRKDTGIYAIPITDKTSDGTKNKRYSEIEDKIKNFFSATDKDIYLVVDTSGISFPEVGITQTTSIRTLCNVAGDWDGAKKSQCSANNTTCEIIEDTKEPLKQAVFGLGNINLNKSTAKATLTAKATGTPTQAQTQTPSISSAVVEVTPLSQCIEQKLKNPKGKVSLAKASNACYGDFKPLDLFDIKRTGDAFQALMTKQLTDQNGFNQCNNTLSTPGNFVFVTLDHLAFLKARLNGVPSIFTAKDGGTEEKLMFLYKRNVDTNALAAQFLTTYKDLVACMDVMNEVKLDGIIINIVNAHGRNQELGERSHNEEHKTNIDFKNKETTIKWFNTLYTDILSNQKDLQLDKLFTSMDELISAKAKTSNNVVKNMTNAMSMLKANANNAYNNFQDDKDSNHYKNLGKLKQWLPETINKILNTILYVEIMARVTEMYKQFTYDGTNWIFNDLNEVNKKLTEVNEKLTEVILPIKPSTNQNNTTKQDLLSVTLMSLDQKLDEEKVIKAILDNYKADASSLNTHISDMAKLVKQYGYLKDAFQNGTLVKSFLGIEIDDYASIFQRITNIINAGLNGKTTGTNTTLTGMISTMNTGTPRQKRARALEIANRLVLSIMNKILDTLISFARVKISSIDISGGNPNGLNDMIATLKRKIQDLSGGDGLKIGGTYSNVFDDISLDIFGDHNILIDNDDVRDPISHGYQDEDYIIRYIANNDEEIKEYEDPYDYGNLIKKFGNRILDAIAVGNDDGSNKIPQLFGFLQEVLKLKNNQSTSFDVVWSTLIPDSVKDNDDNQDWISTFEYYIHWYAEYTMRDYMYLYPGMTAFYSDEERLPININKHWQWDDYACYDLVKDPLSVYQRNCGLLGVPVPEPTFEDTKETEQAQTSAQEQEVASKLSGLTIQPKVTIQPNFVNPSLDMTITINGQSIPIIASSAGGSASAAATASVHKYTLADYCFKYFKPYFELYYKK